MFRFNMLLILPLLVLNSCRKDPSLYTNEEVIETDSVLISTIPFTDTTQNYYVKLIVTNFKTIEGNLNVAFFNSEESFDSETDFYLTETKEVTNDTMILQFKNFPPSVLAISVYHDKNKNNELDKNIIGIPQEGFGFSNDAMGTFGPPTFDMAKIEIKKGVNSSHYITLKYY